MHLTFLFEIGRMGQVTKNIRICLTISTFDIFCCFWLRSKYSEKKLLLHDTNAVRTKIEIFTFEFLVFCWLLLIFILWKLQISNSKKCLNLSFSSSPFWNLLSLPRINSFSYSFLYFFRSFIFLYLFLSEVMFTNLFLFCFHEVACKKCKILFALWHSTDIRFVFIQIILSF